jgi:hypothetical protein
MLSAPPKLRSTPWPWPESLDAMAAAPAYHSVILENDRVRVLQTRIPRGEIVPVHTHRWSSVAIILSRSHFVRRDPDGKITLDTRQLGELPKPNAPFWQEPLPPHTVENVGDVEFVAVQVEMKEAG